MASQTRTREGTARVIRIAPGPRITVEFQRGAFERGRDTAMQDRGEAA